MTAPRPSGQARLCTFVVGDLLLALPVEDVREVIRGEHLTPVALAPAGVVGLLNLRGQIVPAVEARLRLGLAPREADAAPAYVIVDHAGEQNSLVVDREGEVISVTVAEQYPIPETVPADIRRLLTSAYRHVGTLLLVLDSGLVLTLD